MKARLLLIALLFTGSLLVSCSEEVIEPALESTQSGSNGNEIKETDGF